MNYLIGILGFQGAFIEHKNILDKINVRNIIVKTKHDLDKVDALIIPGGESSVMIKFINSQNLKDPLEKFIIQDNKYVMGTCAGAIILSKFIISNNKISDGIIPALDIVIERNSYGSQYDSFIKKEKLKNIGDFNCIFIRAPKIVKLNDNKCEILGYNNNNPIFLKKNNIIICTFHPELEDTNIHEYFVNLIK